LVPLVDPDVEVLREPLENLQDSILDPHAILDALDDGIGFGHG
jgi:hypothetical protein